MNGYQLRGTRNMATSTKLQRKIDKLVRKSEKKIQDLRRKAEVKAEQKKAGRGR